MTKAPLWGFEPLFLVRPLGVRLLANPQTCVATAVPPADSAVEASDSAAAWQGKWISWWDLTNQWWECTGHISDFEALNVTLEHWTAISSPKLVPFNAGMIRSWCLLPWLSKKFRESNMRTLTIVHPFATVNLGAEAIHFFWIPR